MSGWVQAEQAQIGQYAEAFYGLAALFHNLPCQKERIGEKDLEALFEGVKESACAGCRRAQTCWGDEYLKNSRMCYGLLRELEKTGRFPEEQERYLEENCEQPRELELALRTGYEESRNNLLWTNRMLEQRQAAGEQIYQTAELLKRLADGFAGEPKREYRISRRLRRELRYLNVELDGIRIFTQEEGRSGIYLTLHTSKRVVVSAKSIAEALSECCGEAMRPADSCCAAVSSTPELFYFVPDTKYQLFCGISWMKKNGELVSGDNYTLMQKDTGKVIMSLADGMGSGTEANQESGKVIELVEQFLDAGFPQETAVRMINSCMLLQSGSRIFSTIDLCMVDLYNATCDMMKSGAAPSFIRRDGEIEVLRSNAFPAGVLQQADYESMHRKLESGASIVMMTDGVLDGLPGENREQTMAELIIRTTTRNAQEHARRLMERVYLMQEMEARDDMTILIGTIWKK